MEETIAQEALRLLNSVPAEEYITKKLSDDIGACCALGHYGRLKSDDPKNYNILSLNRAAIKDLREVSSTFMAARHNLLYIDIADVNNQKDINGYTEPDIKDRVTHLLKEMVEAGY